MQPAAPRALPDYAACQVSAGVSGDWALVKVHLPERAEPPGGDPRPEAFRFRPGSYTELRCGGITFMTDLYDEWWTQRHAIARARTVGGRVLITGLGLGMVVEAILASPAPAEVSSVTVIEQSPDVIELVAPHLIDRFGERLEIVQADAFTWEPAGSARFETVWHDIWPDPDAACVDADIARLRQHHQRWSDWQGFWPIDYRDSLAARA